MRRGSIAHAVLEQTLRRLREREGSARLTPASLPAALEELDAAIAERARPRPPARAPAPRCASSRSTCGAAAPRGRAGAGLEPRRLEWSFGGEGDEHGPLPLDGAGLGVTGRVDRIDVDAGGRALVRDYKGRDGQRRARAGRATGRLQVALYALAVRELLGLESSARSTSRSATATPRRAALVRDDVPGRYVNGDVVDAEALRRRARRAAREIAARAATDLRAGRIRAVPGPLPPTAAAPTRRSAAPATARPTEARGVTARRSRRDLAAADDRRRGSRPSSARRSTTARGSALLAANAGSGKTAVMVERFVEAVLRRRRRGRRRSSR